VRAEGQLAFNGIFQVLDAALAGLGLAYVPEDLAQPHLAKGRLKRSRAARSGSQLNAPRNGTSKSRYQNSSERNSMLRRGGALGGL
jgi:DNA-binding transcriptional LysR family regulator